MTSEQQIGLSAYHESVQPFAYAEGEALVVRFRLGRGLAQSVDVLHYDKFFLKDVSTVPAELFAQDGAYHDMWQARLQRESKRFKYIFRLQTDSTILYFCRSGVTALLPEPEDAFEVPYLGERDGYEAPTWSIGTTYYQVFPDRFYRGDKQRAKKGMAKWSATPTPHSYFGGTITGIHQKLDHLSALGVSVLYMTPIFAAPSNHKYDTVDYFQIDPAFGTLADFKALVQACHERNIRVVLDAVFNHMGARHPMFLDILERGEASPYADYIYAKSWPIDKQARNYETFGGVAEMPKWRTAHPAVTEYLCRVGEYWIQEADIDGWRLDVSDEVEHAFWKTFRQRIKAHKPDALICGEIWQVATPWLRGDEFDTVMNYPLGRAILDWLARQTTDARGFHERIETMRALYPEPVLPVLWNLLDSHDTPRLLTICKDDFVQAQLASFVSFLFVGSPLLYYGDEVGMRGGADPLCRGGMIWDPAAQNQDAFLHYQALLALRTQHIVLRHGGLRPVQFADATDTYAFVRLLYDDSGILTACALCVVHNGVTAAHVDLTDPRIPDKVFSLAHDTTKVGTAGETRRTLRRGNSLTLAPKSGTLWVWEAN